MRTWFPRKSTPFDKFTIKRIEDGMTLGTPIRFADIDAGNRDSRGEKLLVHPALRFIRVRRQCRCVKDPGLRLRALPRRRQKHKGRMIRDGKSFRAGQQKFWGRTGIFAVSKRAAEDG